MKKILLCLLITLCLGVTANFIFAAEPVNIKKLWLQVQYLDPATGKYVATKLSKGTVQATIYVSEDAHYAPLNFSDQIYKRDLGLHTYKVVVETPIKTYTHILDKINTDTFYIFYTIDKETQNPTKYNAGYRDHGIVNENFNTN
ncbi:MAG: hypothetical protein WC860_04935 [Candidatus Margulisiibacteriota bacterium]|jgi:hypothetical protein